MPPKKTNGQRNLAGTSAPIGENAEEVCPTHGMQTHNGVRTSDSTALTGVSMYEKEIKEMEGVSREEYIGSLRRHHHNGRWEARIGRVFGNKYLYLGTYASEEEAAMAYDMAAIEYRGQNAVTNFDLSRYLNTIPNTNQILEKTSAVDPPETPPESEKPRRSFPDYIQTYFEVCQDSSSFVDDEHDIIFGELDSFVLPMFQCELEYCPNIEAR
ncbi:putative folate-biopterin transporter 3-like [Capsicum annuum]|nr:putative folate-biopterin transporter 3-like [Capsicum annuum]